MSKFLLPTVLNTDKFYGLTPGVAYIGLGSNWPLQQDQGRLEPIEILQHAIGYLSHYGDLQISSLYQTKPMGPQDQPDYLNAVVALKTELLPHDLLDKLQHIEQTFGRTRQRRWGERTLDLDLLLQPPWTLNTPRLTLPHAGLMQRAFVLLPLLDLVRLLQYDGQLIAEYPLVQQSDSICRIADQGWHSIEQK